MTSNQNSDNGSASFWQKIKKFLNLGETKSTKNSDESGESSESGDSRAGGAGGQKIKGQGFIDPKAVTAVRDPETILYNELKKDPAAMQALKELTNGQIPVSEAAAAFERIRNSTVALETIVNSEYAPSDIKAKAREELQQQQRRKLAAQPGFKNNTPKPRGPG